MPFFTARGLHKSYDGREIIAGIDLHVQRGELVSLLGISGVGKTTLFNVLSGLEKPDSGHVWLGEAEITALPGKVSYMQQKDLLLPFKKISDNLALPLLLRGVHKAEARQRVNELLPVFGLEGVTEMYPAQLSGGMRQRAALLRSFLFSSEMMLLDEAFAALDAITKAALHRWFNGIRHNLKLTTLLISHDVDEALLLSNRIYIMAGQPGRLVAEFPVEFSAERDAELLLSREFIALKREILRRLGQ